MAFSRLADAIERLLDALLLAAISVMVAAICWQVFGRYVLNHAPGWTEEVARFLMAWITLLGSAAVLRRRGHIAVTVVVELLPRPVAVAVGLVRDLLILVMAGALGWYGYAFAVIGGRRDSAAMEIPMFYPYLAIPAGAVLIGLLLLLARAGREDRTEAGGALS
ncbi:TRAP-type C4-dicarboxylate transport system, small permease component [Tistlia consotensis]|uniref:TRAP transporter small permease protein n=1 Tax=Tistlia consotensis USBA 355 TaxID=560819 RepID=A0A1Y6B658_9PROT|nr:TRAP transporter small permease [Tistlia consotensis]SME89905.1 TRAP-type C4-dicarboxylate transport system, small permease component [Tistlia consotensis USBA 355]SNR26410.1 TRAP-type C4-dicarboxylate transport system, small permease component [Tistlia consotensis]